MNNFDKIKMVIDLYPYPPFEGVEVIINAQQWFGVVIIIFKHDKNTFLSQSHVRLWLKLICGFVNVSYPNIIVNHG